VRFYEGDKFNYNYDVIYYEDNIELIKVDVNHPYGSEFVENPIIIYNNMSAEQLLSQAGEDSQKITYVNEIMYKISDNEFNRFIKEHDLNGQIVAKTNVLENYNNKWTNAKRILFINLIFSILVLFLELIIISSIIKMEYEVNAVELSIKKVMGYSMFQKNRKIILLTIITTITSILAAIIVALVMDLTVVINLIAGGFVILAVELSVISVHIRKVENSKIQKILKGGNL
jgi:putative ABC transport system permease protein